MWRRKQDPLYWRRKFTWKHWLMAIVGIALAGYLIYMIPAVHSRLEWRLDIAWTFLRKVIDPVEPVPTAVAFTVPSSQPTETFTASPIPEQSWTPSVEPTETETPLPLPSATPLPPSVILPSPPHEFQDWNNCGPAAFSMALKFYGWEGDQEDIASVVKPFRNDRNVNIDELVYYVRNYVGWLNVQYRVGGDLELLKKLIAEGLPVVIESTFWFDKAYWFEDDLWGGHYLFLTGYDDQKGIFVTQNSFIGPDIEVSYAQLDQEWQSFNRAYVVIYYPEMEGRVEAVLGDDWDVQFNRQHALDTARLETESDPENVFAWFNLGTNLVYFEDYAGAVAAYDRARELGLPQRMLRYQFGPFLAYFYYGRVDDLLVLADYALSITPNSEEALLWRGWALYRQGKKAEALENFQAALEFHPDYLDAQYAIDFVRDN